jgi:hypothetical protein
VVKTKSNAYGTKVCCYSLGFAPGWTLSHIMAWDHTYYEGFWLATYPYKMVWFPTVVTGKMSVPQVNCYWHPRRGSRAFNLLVLLLDLPFHLTRPQRLITLHVFLQQFSLLSMLMLVISLLMALTL